MPANRKFARNNARFDETIHPVCRPRPPYPTQILCVAQAGNIGEIESVGTGIGRIE